MIRNALLLMALLTGPAVAQPPDAMTDHVAPEPTTLPPARPTMPRAPVGGVARSAVGEAGQRQTRDKAIGLEPMSRLSSRIDIRVQSRLRTRIDRDYAPQTDPSRPFSTAERTMRTRGLPR
jgi:hypothetical protein